MTPSHPIPVLGPRLCLPPDRTLRATYTPSPHQHTQGNAAAEKDALKDAEGEIKALRESGEKGKDKAIDELLQAVKDTDPTAA